MAMCMSLNQLAGQPMARGGVLDLRDVELRKDGPVELEGEWHFYWGKLIDPAGPADTSGLLVPVPSAWHRLKGEVPGISAHGYASYKLRILVPAGLENIAFRFTEVFSASGYYVNGKNIGFNGLPGTNRYQAVFGYTPSMFVVPVTDSVLDLVVHVSNFEHRSGGIRGNVEIGTPMQIMVESAERQYRDFFLLGALLVIGVYFMVLYLMRARLYILFFSLIGLIMAFRVMLLSDTTLFSGDWVSGISRLRLEYLSFDLLVPLYVLMYRFLFPDDFPVRLFRIILWICSLMIVLVIITPVSLFTQVFPYYLVFVMLTAVAIFFVLARSWLRGRIYAPAFTIGFAVAVFGAIMDMLNVADVTEMPMISHFTMFIFLLIYAIVFSAKHIDELRRNRLASDEILQHNEALIAGAEEKEQQNRSQNEALHMAREELQKSRASLETAIELRNKFLTVLGHDIKAPIGYAKQVIDMILNGDLEEREQTEMLKLVSNSSHTTLGLLENLIYWGRSQSGELRNMAVQFQLNRIINETIDLFDLPLKDKMISLVMEIPDEVRAFADKDHMKLVLRNLLSNAIKFTKTGGRIVVRGAMDQDSNETWIEIEDNGVGIPPAELKALLTSDGLYSTVGTKKEKGTGIGLQLCRELTGINNGTFQIESEVGKGTLFRVILPLHPSH